MFHAILSNFDFLTPPYFENFIGSQKFQNETMFHAILINFDFWTPPPPPNIKEILENTRFGLTYVWTENFFFQILFIFFQIFFLIQIFLVQIFWPFHIMNWSISQPNLKLIDVFSREFWPF